MAQSRSFWPFDRLPVLNFKRSWTTGQWTETRRTRRESSKYVRPPVPDKQAKTCPLPMGSLRWMGSSHLLCKGKYHCTACLQFGYIELCQTREYLYVVGKDSNWRSLVQWSFPFDERYLVLDLIIINNSTYSHSYLFLSVTKFSENSSFNECFVVLDFIAINNSTMSHTWLIIGFSSVTKYVKVFKHAIWFPLIITSQQVIWVLHVHSN